MIFRDLLGKGASYIERMGQAPILQEAEMIFEQIRTGGDRNFGYLVHINQKGNYSHILL